MRILFNFIPKNSGPTTTTTNNTSDVAYGGVVHGRADSQALLPIEPYDDDENVAGMGTANAHPFGYHSNGYTGGTTIEEEEEDGGVLAMEVREVEVEDRFTMQNDFPVDPKLWVIRGYARVCVI